MQQSLDGIEPAKPKRVKREKGIRDESWKSLFATMIEVCGGNAPVMRADQGRYANAVDALRDKDITRDELVNAAKRWRVVYPNATITPSAIVRHWSTLQPKTITYAKPYDVDEANRRARLVSERDAKLRAEGAAARARGEF